MALLPYIPPDQMAQGLRIHAARRQPQEALARVGIRVVAADGGLRGYLGKRGVQTKAWLLQLEGARPQAPNAVRRTDIQSG